MLTKTTAFALLALMAGSALAQDAVTFRRTFEKDSVERYAMTTDMTMTMGMMGETSKSTSKITGDFIIRVLALKEDGSADVEIKTENNKIETEADGQKVEGEEEMPDLDTSGKGNLNPFMKLTGWKPDDAKSQGADIMSGMGASMESSFVMMQFPEKPVKPGDEWEIPMPTMDFFAKDQKIGAKFLGSQPFGEGKSVYVISYSGDLKLDIDLKKMMGETEDKEALEALGEIKMDGTMTIRSAVYVDPKTFAIVKSTSNAVTKTTMKSSMFDMDMETEIKSEMKLK